MHDDEHDAGRPDWFRVGQFIFAEFPGCFSIRGVSSREDCKRLIHAVIQAFPGFYERAQGWWAEILRHTALVLLHRQPGRVARS